MNDIKPFYRSRNTALIRMAEHCVVCPRGVDDDASGDPEMEEKTVASLSATVSVSDEPWITNAMNCERGSVLYARNKS